MTGRWKAWKTTNRFPPLPTAPWKSRKDGEIPTFPPPGVAPRGRVENQRAVFHSPPRSSRRRRLAPPKSKTKPSGVPPERQEKGRHYPLVRRCLFSIILHWKRKSISVSFFDWKMLLLLRRQAATGNANGHAHVQRTLGRSDAETVGPVWRADRPGGTSRLMACAPAVRYDIRCQRTSFVIERIPERCSGRSVPARVLDLYIVTPSPTLV